ncbi:copper amine oxidase N-terminal domain-containing protein [Paenibacillus odorifer]|uniref:copper amine oxidase N-terminal domain-containing protein n=1 Tax=Paenibacillus odorifer TaxID=189426 RepID=UPI002DB636CA|nr:copper amine oxidase N-terminal domain-containing protein [Paenibacillus odorifer]MEC0131891.1 copper amine oxidase N-terminal domain-containing protein [Paenibacillus odorifer]MEC0224317.1 copper amine oxidase N-terminal domain-containing protein [Paenibacillus odorifer]
MKNHNFASKMITFFMVMISFAVLFSSQALADDSDLKCYLDGKQIHFNVSPILKDGVTYVPMRSIFEALGATIKWDNHAKSVSAVKGDINIFYLVKEGRVIVNAKENEHVLKGINFQNNTLVPLRFISEVLGSSVTWDEGAKSIYITSPVAEEKLIAPVNRTISVGSQEQSKSLSDERNRFVINVKHYGIKNNQLYSLLEFSNMDNKDISINFKPGDQKIIKTFSKEKDPMPTLKIENCTEVTHKVVIDNIGGNIYKIPEFSVNQACVSSNQSQQDALDVWRNNNSGLSELGSNLVSVRKYIQDQTGGLQNFVIPANKAEQLILVAPVGGKDRLVVEGSYFVGGLSNKTIEFQLDYEVVSELDLGIYSYIYTEPVY